jgi:ATP/maltotriose-dependent transcriptional regulator MalT/DNA-binding SARP family transcriptional activator
MRRKKRTPGRRAAETTKPAPRRRQASILIAPSRRPLAKLSKPATRRMLSRLRLFKAIDRSEARLVWVSGPPGAGKTTLLSTYVTARSSAVLWYQLDRGDNDIAAFFYYLREAVAKRGRATLPLFTLEYLPDLKGFGRRYFRDLFAMLPQRAVLVLDNYQELDESSPLHSVLREAFTEIPETITVLVASRSGPPPEYARLVAGRMLDHLDWEDLRLTRAEIEALAYRAGPISKEDLDALCAQCDGWAVGLVLLLAQRARQATHSAAPSASPQTVFDYFAAEIFNDTAPQTRDFLLRTAFLPHLKPNLAAALSGNNNAGELLDSLYRRRRFVNRSETAFQFHPLLREFLLARARATFSKPELDELARRAAALLEGDGQIAESAQLYREAGDWTDLTRLVCQHAGNLLGQGRHTTVEAWIAAIPPEQTEASPWLLFWHGTARLAALDPQKSRELLEHAYADFKREDDLAGQFLACAGVLDTYWIEWNEFSPTDRWMHELEMLVERRPDLVSPEIEARVISSLLSVSFRQPQHPWFTAWQGRALELLRASTNPHQQIALSTFVFQLSIWRGDFRRSAALLREIESMLNPRQSAPLMLIVLKTWKTLLQWVLAEHDAAYRSVEEILRIADESGVHLLDAQAYGYLAFAATSAGDLDKAEDTLARMEALVIPSRGHDVSFLSHLKSIVALLRGELAPARHYAMETLARVEAAGASSNVLLAQIVLAQVLIEQSEHGAARGLLAEARRLGEGMSASYFVFTIWVAEANSLFQSGEEEQALAALARAFSIGREYDYLNCHPVWLPKVMARLCAAALEHGIEKEYANRLIRKRGLLAPTPEALDWPFPVKVYTLGRFGVLIDGKPLQFSGKAQRKPIELLMALIAFGGREVNEVQLTEALWPDAEGDAAHEACAIALHRLRKLLGIERAVSLQRNHFSLDPRYVWVDVWAFERALTSAQGEPGNPLAAQRTISLYQGLFLAKHAELTWALPLRERLRSKFLRYMAQRGRAMIESREFEAAIVACERGLSADPLAEELYCSLMHCYRAMDRRAEAIGVYQRCQKTLAAALGVSPAPETVALYRSLQG